MSRAGLDGCPSSRMLSGSKTKLQDPTAKNTAAHETNRSVVAKVRVRVQEETARWVGRGSWGKLR